LVGFTAVNPSKLTCRIYLCYFILLYYFIYYYLYIIYYLFIYVPLALQTCRVHAMPWGSWVGVAYRQANRLGSHTQFCFAWVAALSSWWEMVTCWEVESDGAIEPLPFPPPSNLKLPTKW
jgi:hypothetical protein